jgi:hypothetical protein
MFRLRNRKARSGFLIDRIFCDNAARLFRKILYSACFGEADAGSPTATQGSTAIFRANRQPAGSI